MDLAAVLSLQKHARKIAVVGLVIRESSPDPIGFQSSVPPPCQEQHSQTCQGYGGADGHIRICRQPGPNRFWINSFAGALEDWDHRMIFLAPVFQRGIRRKASCAPARRGEGFPRHGSRSCRGTSCDRFCSRCTRSAVDSHSLRKSPCLYSNAGIFNIFQWTGRVQELAPLSDS